MADDDEEASKHRFEHLAGEYIRVPPLGRRRPGDESYYEWRYALEQLRRANEVLEFIVHTRRDPYETFANIDQTLSDAHGGLSTARSVLRSIGFLELLDDHLETIMHGLYPDSLPLEEADALAMLGFPHLAATVRAETELIGQEWRTGTAKGMSVAREYRRSVASSAIDNAIEQVDAHRRERREAKAREEERESPTRESTNEPRKERKWWKGLGAIVEGASLATVDVGLAIGALRFPVSPETRTYGAVVSVGAGFGKIMGGVGDLWGE